MDVHILRTINCLILIIQYSIGIFVRENRQLYKYLRILLRKVFHAKENPKENYLRW